MKEYRIIDPANQDAQLHTLQSGRFEPIAIEDGTFRSIQLPGFWIALSWLWAIPTPSIPEVQDAWRTAGS